ncbi:pyridoxal-phosphate dependent enzyme [Pseudomonas aeruginosa]
MPCAITPPNCPAGSGGKRDSHLPISGSIKARGGICEVLAPCRAPGPEHGLVGLDDYSRLAEGGLPGILRPPPDSGGLHRQPGPFPSASSAPRWASRPACTCPADARQWKKDKLRAHGVTVVGVRLRLQCRGGTGPPLSGRRCIHIRRRRKLPRPVPRLRRRRRATARPVDAAGIRVDSEHPLFVHLPCGVGGGPGGVAFGLCLAFGDAVHCLFAEPTHSPCMFLGVYTGRHEQVSRRTSASTSAPPPMAWRWGVRRASSAAPCSACSTAGHTVDDDELLRLLALLERSQGIRLEPSALAGAAHRPGHP